MQIQDPTVEEVGVGVMLMNVAEGECIQSGPLSRLDSYLGLLAVLCLFWALGGCGRDEGLPMPVGISAAELPEPVSDGAQLTARYCSQCHGIPSPTSQRHADNRIADLHVWSIGSEVYAGIISLVTDDPKPPEYYKALLPDGLGVVHTTVEVHQCRH